MPSPTPRLIMFALGPGISSAYLICQVCSLQEPSQPISQDTWLQGFTRELSISNLHLRNVSWAIFIIPPNYFKHEFKSWIDVHGSGRSLLPNVNRAGLQTPKPVPSNHFFQQPPQTVLPAGSQVFKCMSLLWALHHLQTPLPTTMHPMHKKQF